ncbi:hypothetical protein FHETE_9173 [Fusarium heterosporum]|uniref:Uncharacterized protein n=1 Tax=Fusarium heterosporum TaxID=42747 RepID=A0A8H5SZJ3_FUSHE|nr:hypothetical protein FHETE_9173 [Fusarium heterosporum]
MGDQQLQSNVDTCGKIAQDAFKLFATPLQEPWTRTKAPYGLNDALTALRSEEQLATDQEQVKRDTEKTFLKAGFQAWLAYFLTNRDQQYHHPKQASKHQTLQAFHNLSTVDRSQVATAIARIKCHETVKVAIESLMADRKRQKELINEIRDEESSDCATNATLPSLPSADSAMTVSTAYTNTATPSLQSTIAGLPSTDRLVTVPDPPGTLEVTEDPAAAFIQAQQCTLGSFQALMDLFPPYICGAVAAKDGKANITMDFPHATKHGLKLHCLMSLVIKASQIQFITWRLFHVQISTGDDGIRHQELPNGGRGIARQGFQFQGSLDVDIDNVLGSKMAKAIGKSPVREAELVEGITATRRLAIAPQHRFASTVYSVGCAQSIGEIFTSVKILLINVLIKRQQNHFIFHFLRLAM